LIDNKKIDAISERDVIEKGTQVEVVKVEGINIVVRKVKDIKG
jgi:membrane-bound ClpP family serine protease